MASGQNLPQRSQHILKWTLFSALGAGIAAEGIGHSWLSMESQTKGLAQSRKSRVSQAPLTKVYVAGFWRRLAAAFIDLAVILPVALLLCWVAGSITGLSLPESRISGIDFWLDLFLDSDPALFGAIGLTLGIASVYTLIFQVAMAQTLGMRVTRLHIIDLYGEKPSMPKSLLRSAGYLFGVASLGLGFLWIAFDSEKRGLQDWLAGTYVIRSSPPS